MCIYAFLLVSSQVKYECMLVCLWTHEKNTRFVVGACAGPTGLDCHYYKPSNNDPEHEPRAAGAPSPLVSVRTH